MVENKIFFDTDTICLDENFSTTRLLTKEKPVMKQKPDYKLEPTLFLSANPKRKGEGGLRTKGYFKKSYDDKPLICIVTVVYNGEKHLEQTINSVLDQDYDNVEYIVIDGGSSDGTLEIIKKYEGQVDYWVSEQDGGIYDAMNKGASLCSGRYIAFLNADDWYNNNAFKNAIAVINSGHPDYIFSDVDIYVNEKLYIQEKADLDRVKNRAPFNHQTLFVKRDILLEIPFDINYLIIADYNLMIQLVKKKYSYKYIIDKPIASFRGGGASTVMNYNYEAFRLHKKEFGLLNAIHMYFLRQDNKLIVSILKQMQRIKHKSSTQK